MVAVRAARRFSSLTVTIVFAVYALAVALSLFLAGHLSDWYGRRRVLMSALALEVLAGVVFIAWPSLPGLLLARVLSGLGIGALTATADGLAVRVGRRRQPARAARRAVANLGGLGLGGLISGALAQWAGDPLVCRLWCSSWCCCWLGGAAGRARDASPPIAATALPAAARVGAGPLARPLLRRRSWAAAITFAVFGLLTSLAPSFLAGTLHQRSHALAGACLVRGVRHRRARADADRSRTSQQLLAAAIPRCWPASAC